MSDLIEFLLARIAEDEEAAARIVDVFAPSSVWMHTTPLMDVAQTSGSVIEIRARSGPRVLAECQVKRRILAEHERGHGQCLTCRGVDGDEWTNEPYPCRTLRLLALAYADHPDYPKEWRP